MNSCGRARMKMMSSPMPGSANTLAHRIRGMLTSVSLRERVADVLHRAGALNALMAVRRIAPGPKTLTILTYHHIADGDASSPYDPGVADATPAQFRRQMQTLVRFCTPIGIDELVDAIEGAPLPKNPVMVTFDDGYRSCHDVALPILREVGMRAAFFVATSFVAERRVYWWERIAIVLANARVATAKLAYPLPLTVVARDPSSQRMLVDIIKDTVGLDVGRFLDEIYAAFGVDWNRDIEAKHADAIVMTWDHLRALSRAGMNVESHTR